MIRRLAWSAALLGYFVLLGTVVAWNAWLEPPTRLPRILPLLVFGLPLLAVLRGLLHGRRKTCQLASLLALVYFSLGLTAIAGGDIVHGWLQTTASLVWFLGLIFYLRRADT